MLYQSSSFNHIDITLQSFTITRYISFSIQSLSPPFLINNFCIRLLHSITLTSLTLQSSTLFILYANTNSFYILQLQFHHSHLHSSSIILYSITCFFFFTHTSNPNQSLIYQSLLINLIAGSFFSLNEWIFKNRSRYYFKELIENKTFPMLYWNLDELNYDDYVRRHMIGINKYLHREDFTMESNKMHVTR